MDVVGFVLATGFLVAVYAVFGAIGRLLDIVSAGVRATVAPSMLSGFRAWTGPLDGEGCEAGPGAGPDDDPDAGDPDTRSDDERRLDPGLLVPVARLGRANRLRAAA